MKQIGQIQIFLFYFAIQKNSKIILLLSILFNGRVTAGLTAHGDVFGKIKGIASGCKCVDSKFFIDIF